MLYDYSGTLNLGGQMHWYLEPHALTVIPSGDGDEITVLSCTQCVMKTQVGTFVFSITLSLLFMC